MTTKEEAFFGVKNTVEDPADVIQSEDDLAVEVIDDTPEEDRPYVNTDTDAEVSPEAGEGDEKEDKSVGEFLQEKMKGGGTRREQIEKQRFHRKGTARHRRKRAKPCREHSSFNYRT